MGEINENLVTLHKTEMNNGRSERDANTNISMNQIIHSIAIFLVLANFAYAEYRVYELEVYDRMERKSEVIITTFSPNDYILTHGGDQRVGIILRASWMCYGDTSHYEQPCSKPQTIDPRFAVGDHVQVMLKHHVTDKWKGVIENSFYRPDLKSNVYGVRFPDRRRMYARYYEANLQPLKKESKDSQPSQ